MTDQGSGFHVDGPAITAVAAKIEQAATTIRQARTDFVGSSAKVATEDGTLPDATGQANYKADYQAMVNETRRVSLGLTNVAAKIKTSVSNYQSGDGDAAADITSADGGG